MKALAITLIVVCLATGTGLYVIGDAFMAAIFGGVGGGSALIAFLLSFIPTGVPSGRKIRALIRPVYLEGSIVALKAVHEAYPDMDANKAGKLVAKYFWPMMKEYADQKAHQLSCMPVADRANHQMQAYLTAAGTALRGIGGEPGMGDVMKLAAQWYWADVLAERGKRPLEMF